MDAKFTINAETVNPLCPRCRQAELQPTGGLSVCPVCRLAITQQALRMEQGNGGDKDQ